MRPAAGIFAILALVFLAGLTPPALADVDRQEATSKALSELGSKKGDDPVVVFGLRRTLPAGTLVSQSAPSGPATALAGTPFARNRQQRIRRAGVNVRRASRVIRAGDEPVWLFHEDTGPHQAFEHPGRIVLVGARSGDVRVSRAIRWVPMVGGRVLPHFRSASAYESERHRVFSRAWPVEEIRPPARPRGADDAVRQPVADALAAERSCALRVSDTVGDFFDFGRVDVTRSRLGNFFEHLEDLNAGFVSRRYTTKEGLTPIESAQALIDDAGCRDLLLYVAGAAPRAGDAGIVIGIRPAGGDALEWHTLTGEQLEALVKRNREITFKFVFDAPYARMNDQLIDEPNTRLLISSGGAGTGSFTFLPELLGPNGVEGNPNNPQQLLEFTNAVLGGLWIFTGTPRELADWKSSSRGTSLMTWMVARTLGLSPARAFIAPLDLIKLPDLESPVDGSATNRPPVPGTLPQSTREDTATTFALNASDPDGDPLTFTITDGPDQGTLSGTPPNVVYTPRKDFAGADRFTYEVADNRGARASEEVPVRVTPSNDPAVVTTTSGGTLAAFVEDGAPVVVDAGLTVTDADSARLKSATVTIVDGKHAGDVLLFTDGNGITGSYADGVLRLTGDATAAQYRDALRSVEFDTTSQAPGARRTMQFRAEDGDDTGTPGSRDVTVEPVNDAPALSVPGAQSLDEDSTRTFASSNGNAISIADPDAGGDAIDVDLVVTHGTLTLGSTSGLGSTTGSGTASVALSGTVSAVNAALSGLSYAPAANYHGADTLEVAVDDAGHDGSGGAKTDAESVAITVASVNDRPINTVPGAQTLDEDATRSLDLGVADPDANELAITIGVTHGTLTLGGTSGLTNLSGNGTGTVSFVGTPAEATAALDDLVYAPSSNYHGSDTLTIKSDDGTATDTDTVALTVSSVNDAPVSTLPVATTLDEDTSRTFTTAGVSDADAGNADIEVRLDVDHGTIALDGTSGLTFAAGANGSGSMTFTGSQSDADAALSGLEYKPGANYFGSDTLDLTTSDLGNTGPGTRTDSDSTAITVSSVADAPANVVPGAQSAVENTALTLGTVSVSDVDTANLKVTLDVDHGTLTLPTTTGLTFTTGDGTGDATMVFSGTQPALNDALDGIDYTPASGYVGSDGLTVTSDDGALSDTDTVAISVGALNKAPVNTVPGAQTVSEDTNLVFSDGNGNAISVADADAAGDGLRVELDVGVGSLTLSTTSGLAFIRGDGTSDNSMAFEGTLSELNAALAGLTYRGPANFSGSEVLGITTNDLGNNGAGGAQNDSDTVNIAVSAVNDAPEHVVPAAQTVAEGGTLTLSAANMNRIAVGDVDAGGSAIQTTISVAHGALTLASTTGLTFTGGDGTSDTTMTFSGARTAINTALDGLQYAPAADYAGAEQLSIVTSDLGSTGSGGAKTDSDDLVITVSGVNDAPTIAVPTGPLTVAENGSTPVSVSVADIDAGSGDLAVTLTVAHGTIALATTSGLTFTTGDGTNDAEMTFEGTTSALNAAMNDVTYSPTPNYFGADTLNAAVNDKGNTGSGGALGDSDSVAFDVEEANSAPVTGVPGTQTFNEDTNRTFSNANGNAITISDPDALASDDLEMRLQSTHGVLDVTASTGDLTSIAGDASNDLTVRGTASELNAVLNGLVFDPDQDYAGGANLNVIAADLGNRGAGGQKMDNDDVPLTITAVNDAPALSEPADFDVDEGATKTLSGASAHQVGDVDATSVEVALSVSHGRLTLDGVAGLTFTAGDGTNDAAMTFSGTVANVNAALDGMQYAANDNDGSTDTLSASVDDKGSTGGGNLTDSDSVAITINALNEAPVHTVPGTQTFDEDTTRSFSNGNGNAISVADGDAGAANVRTTLTSTQGAMSIDTTGLEFSCGACAGDGTNDTTMTFEGTISAINAALQTLVYSPNQHANGAAKITIVTNDLGNSGGGGAQSDSDDVNLSITAVNDAPVNTVPGAQSVTEDTGLVFSTGNGNRISTDDLDAGSNAVQAMIAVDHGTFSLNGRTGLSFTTGDGTDDPTMAFTGTVANINMALNGLQYSPALNFNGADAITLTINDQGNTGGGALQDADAVSITVNPVNDAPVADDETFNDNDGAIGNTALVVDDPDDGAPSLTTPKKSISGNILAGDTDVEESASSLTVTPGTFATNDGGSVTLESDGDFVLEPATATSCTDASDFFDYTVEDNSTAPPGELTDTGRVTVAIAGCVWYVNNSSQGNSGSSQAPFATLQQAETASGSNHTVFVFDGDDTTTGYNDSTGYQMNPGERLLGESEDLRVDPDQGGPLTSQTLLQGDATKQPSVTASGADVISLDDGNEVRGFVLDPQGAGSSGISGITGDSGGGTIDDVQVLDTGTAGAGPGFELNGATGTFTITNLTVDNTASTTPPTTAFGVSVISSTADFSSTSIKTKGVRGLNTQGGNLQTSTFDQIVVTGSTTGGVKLDNTSGSQIALGDGIGTDLDLATTSGSDGALYAAGLPANALSVDGAGTDILVANGGPALDLRSAPSALTFDTVSSFGSGGDGVNLENIGSTPFVASSGAIGGYFLGIGFDVHGGSGNITYPGTFNNGGTDTAVEITGRTGGTVTFSGSFADSGDNGGGFVVGGAGANANTGGTTIFSGTSKVLNTGILDAVTFTNSDGHTLELTGGGLDIDTVSGRGVNATSAGTLRVSGANNMVNTGFGRAVSVVDTDLSSNGFTFQSVGVSATGGQADYGVLLSNTGSAAGMTITGNDAGNTVAPGTGGTIHNVSRDGVSLTSADNFSADELKITNADQRGINGTNVTNFSLTDSQIADAGDTKTDVNLFSAIAFHGNDRAALNNNLDGAVTITGNLIERPYVAGLDVWNYSGTISDLQVENNTVTSATTTADSKDDGLQFIIRGSGGGAAAITKASVQNNVITNFPNGGGIVFETGNSAGSSAPQTSAGVPDSATNKIVINANRVRGDATNKLNSSAISAGIAGRGQGNFAITNNGTNAEPLTNTLLNGVAVGAAGNVTGDFLVANNTVNNPNPGAADAIAVGSDKNILGDGSTLADPNLDVSIVNNVVQATDGSPVEVLQSDSNGSMDVLINNNDLGMPGAGLAAVRVENGSSGNAAYSSTMCLDATGNASNTPPPDSFGRVRSGITLFKPVSGGQYPTSFVGGGTTQGSVETSGTSKNPSVHTGSGSSLYTGKKFAITNGDTFGNCSLPAMP